MPIYIPTRQVGLYAFATSLNFMRPITNKPRKKVFCCHDTTVHIHKRINAYSMLNKSTLTFYHNGRNIAGTFSTFSDDKAGVCSTLFYSGILKSQDKSAPDNLLSFVVVPGNGLNVFF